jgi:NADH-quinone oxidoreductase subunit C
MSQDKEESSVNEPGSQEEVKAPDPVISKLQAQFGTDLLNAYESYGMKTVVVNSERILDVMKFLKEDPELNFHFLTDLCGVHYPNNAGQELGVIYHLHNFMKNTRLRVEAFFSSENPHIATMTSLWSAANWMERETYDFYGIDFEGHPDMRRILNMDDLGYFPMLKQYPLEDMTREDKNDKMFGR